MNFQLEQSIEVLSRTPATLTALLQNISAPWYLSDEGPDTWTPYDVVGHLIHAEETNWIPRAKMILEHGEAQTFPPFNRFAMFELYRTQTMKELLAIFADWRARNLATLKGWKLSEAQLDLTGTHPDLGQVTLRQLLATWVVHDLNHVGQIVAAMSKSYTEAVGPWRQFLGILNR